MLLADFVMRRFVLAAAALLLAACYHDNASPFVHGAHNAPSRGGSTWASAQSPATQTTSTEDYGADSGDAGGFRPTRTETSSDTAAPPPAGAPMTNTARTSTAQAMATQTLASSPSPSPAPAKTTSSQP